MKVTTIGLGYIGLPTSALIASKGIQVHGVDVNPTVVSTINEGRIHIVEPDLDAVVASAVKKGFLTAAAHPEKGDVYLIVVPTPFKDGHHPDTSYVESATKAVIPLLEAGDLFVIESTSPVGTTEKMAELIFSERPDLRDDVFIAYCPERVLPGNVMYELVHNDRVIGGINDGSTEVARDFYSRFVEGQLHSTHARTAEMCKLVENSSRDAQIAFANELSVICDKAGIDVWELIDLANKHPRVNILQPGCGVGGHCIAVDPYFIASQYPDEARMIGLARETNNAKTDWCISKIEKVISDVETKVQRTPKVAFLGLSFKPNIDDLRESPALSIALRFKTSYPDNKLFFVEPNIKNHDELPITDLDTALKECDVCFVLVAHSEFVELSHERIVSFVNLG